MSRVYPREPDFKKFNRILRSEGHRAEESCRSCVLSETGKSGYMDERKGRNMQRISTPPLNLLTRIFVDKVLTTCTQ